MDSSSSTSWLLAKRHPAWPERWYDESLRSSLNLWWAVLRQACLDLRYGHEQEYLDARDFLTTTGVWLATELFPIDEDSFKRGITALIILRRRERGEEPYSTT